MDLGLKFENWKLQLETVAWISAVLVGLKLETWKL